MIVILFGLIGAIGGWLRASKLGGNRLDKLQFAAGFGIALALIGLVLTVILDRNLG